MGARKWPPSPQTLGPPRRSRGGPRHPARRKWPPTKDGGPEMAPKPPNARAAPAEPWRPSSTGEAERRSLVRGLLLQHAALHAAAGLIDVEDVPERGDLARGIAAHDEDVGRPAGGEAAGDR